MADRIRGVPTRGWGDRALGLAFGAALLALLAGLVSLPVVLVTRGVERADTWASVLDKGLALAGALVTLVTWWSGRRAIAEQPDRLEQAVTDLAETVRRQWTREEAVRSLRGPEPIRIRWSSTGRLAEVLEKGVVPGRPVRLRHDVHHVLELFRKVQARQLVVLGAPGAGKTVLALLFTLGLLDSLLPGEPVPVLLSASSWDPRTEHLHTWLARRILEEYPALANYGPDAAQQMVLQGRVMVVLDGLDELPKALLPRAIAALAAAVTDKYSLVVTCRGGEYRDAVTQSSTILTHAAVLEIEPVDLDDAAAFLMAPGTSAQDRWGPVLVHLRLHSDVPLARVLTSPLMVSLARTVYAVPASGHPSQLLDLPDQDAVEHRLLEAFIPAAYHDSPAPPGTPSTSAQHHYSPEQARRWLIFLARRFGAEDLAWWRLVDTIPRSTRGVGAGFTVGLPLGLLVGFMNFFARTGIIEIPNRVTDLLLGLLYGLVTGLVTGLAAYSVRQLPEPVRVEMRFQGKLVPFLRRLVLGLAMGVGVGSGFGLAPGGALAVGVAFGCAFATPVWLDVPAEVAKVSGPGVVLRQDRTVAFSFGLAVALLFGLTGGLVVGFPARRLAFGVIGGGGAMLVGALMGALAGGVAGGIMGGRRYGRVGRRMFAFVGVVLGGLVFIPPHSGSHAILGLANGAIFGLTVGGVGVLSRAWGAYTVSRIWLALRGEQPWRLMRFLEDAHRLGVLRQSGATYQFRHARVQEHLVHTDP